MTSGAQPELELSIVMPAYNEAARIGPTVREYLDYFAPAYGAKFEVIAAFSGSIMKLMKSLAFSRFGAISMARV